MNQRMKNDRMGRLDKTGVLPDLTSGFYEDTPKRENASTGLAAAEQLPDHARNF